MSNDEATLLEKTRHLFENRSKKLTIKKISAETTLNENWVKAFPHIQNPGIKYVEILFNYLNQN